MSEPIFSLAYWRKRYLREMPSEHHKVYEVPEERWNAIAEHHRTVFASIIKPAFDILDVGCGWGRVLDLLPSTWNGLYTGIDLCPEFIGLAQRRYKHLRRRAEFIAVDFREMLPMFREKEFDIAITIAVKNMVRNNAGEETWRKIDVAMQRVARSVLNLEYELPGD